MIRRLIAVFAPMAVLLSFVPAAQAAAPSEVPISVVSYRLSVVHEDASWDRINVTGEVRNTSAYRINPYAIVGLAPGNNGASISLYDLGLTMTLAPGQRSGFVVSQRYLRPHATVKVTYASAGGYVTGAPVGYVGVSQVGAVVDSGMGDAVQVELRNPNAYPVTLDRAVATFRDSTGRTTWAGYTDVSAELAAGATTTVWVVGLWGAPHATSASVSINARRTDASPGPVVATTNWFSDTAGSSLQDDIGWLLEQGITTGCGGLRFCPKQTVTRGQMAIFLTRALDLPPATKDWFTDDDGTSFEDYVNRMAEAGITTGCGGGRFCPLDDVTRGQMASFLARAFALPASPTDYFTDDETSPHEADINRIAKAGITTGCGGGRYCPKANVLREQMAAFLHRALTD